ncbi:MAG: deoxyribose-phosphate aldolase [Phycisphaerae bacterium]
MIDHSLLSPTMTDEEIRQGAELAREHNVAGVCVKPYAVKMVAEILKGSTVKPGVTIGFPHGSHPTSVKAAESQQTIEQGAVELDMVVNIGKVLSGDWDYVRRDIEAVVTIAHVAGAIVKVIFENCYLREEHKIKLCEICGELKVDFVKTSTGFGSSGAAVEDVKLMRTFSPPQVQVKAAGGIRSLEKLLEFQSAGATRIGATATTVILDECRKRFGSK